MRFLISDVKRGLTERSFCLSVVIGMFSVMIPFAYYIIGGEISDGAQLFVLSQSMIMPFIAPILAAIAYSTMNMTEKENKFDILMISRCNMKGFEIKRFVTNGVISGCAIVVPLIILFVSSMGVSNFGLRTEEIISMIAIDFLFGFAYGSLAYSLTFLNKKKYIPIIGPQVAYMLFIYAFPYLGLSKFYPPLSFALWIMPEYSTIGDIIFSLNAIIVVSAIIVIFSKCVKKINIVGGK